MGNKNWPENRARKLSGTHGGFGVKKGSGAGKLALLAAIEFFTIIPFLPSESRVWLSENLDTLRTMSRTRSKAISF